MAAMPMIECDVCGGSFPYGEPGSSWVCIPHSAISLEDIRDRCRACTEARGPVVASEAGNPPYWGVHKPLQSGDF